MSTEKQKKIANLIIKNSTLDKPMNGGKIVENSGYGKTMSKYPKRVIATPGVIKALKNFGFDELSAKKVVAKIMLDDMVDPNSRLKATDQVFKVSGAYANVKIDLQFSPKEDLKEYD
jgi:Holliday junction resolvasome RuvABC DNA-binding subunit